MSRNSSLQVGIARRDISPPLGTALFGYPQERVGNVIADALNATALVLQSEKCRAAIISLDVAQIDESDVAAIRRDVSDATGIEARNITICATHTHSGPTTIGVWGWGEKNGAYLDSICPRITLAVVKAQNTLQRCRVGFGKTSSDIGINRREVLLDGSIGGGQQNQWGPRDRDLTVVRFQTLGKSSTPSTLATLVHLSAHPTSRGLEPSISRDWPGVMMDRLENLTGAPVLFLNGAFGDVGPRTTCGGYVGDGAPAAAEVGLRAAADAIIAWRNIKEFRDVALQTNTEILQLPNAPLPSQKDAEREIAARADDENARGSAASEWHFWHAVLAAHDAPLQATRDWQQTITRIGPLAIVPFAGEIFSEIALRIKHHSPFQYTLCAGTSNGSHGYYVTRDARARGGYEAWVARAYGAYILADDIDDFLVRENVRLLEKLHNEEL